MKGIVVDCETGKTEEVDDGEPFPEYLIQKELTEVDLREVKKLLDYFKKRGRI